MCMEKEGIRLDINELYKQYDILFKKIRYRLPYQAFEERKDLILRENYSDLLQEHNEKYSELKKEIISEMNDIHKKITEKLLSA